MIKDLSIEEIKKLYIFYFQLEGIKIYLPGRFLN